MKVCIHGSTKSSIVGGCCLEVISGGYRIFIYFGLPLDRSDLGKSLILSLSGFPETYYLTDKYKYGKYLTTDYTSPLALIISCTNLNHLGLLPFVGPSIPVIAAPNVRRIIDDTYPSRYAKWPFPVEGRNLISLETIHLGPFIITPWLTAGSNYDAFSLLIEADGKWLLYSGDLRMFRMNKTKTRKQSNMQAIKQVMKFSGMVDTLIMEMIHVNTPGHSQISEVQQFVQILNPGAVEPIHSNDLEIFKKYFNNVKLQKNGEKWNV